MPDDGFFEPIRPASLEQLLAVTRDISEMTRILVAPLGLSPKLQVVDDSVLEAAVRDRLAIGSPAAVELACEKHSISPGAHALAAVKYEKHAQMKVLLREQEELVQTLFNPPAVIELPSTASVGMLAGIIAELEAAMGDRSNGPFDGQQARRLIATIDQLNQKHSWSQHQLQALAECFSGDVQVGGALDRVSSSVLALSLRWLAIRACHCVAIKIATSCGRRRGVFGQGCTSMSRSQPRVR